MYNPFANTTFGYSDEIRIPIQQNFIVKEVAVLKQGTVLTHYIFTSPVPWKFLTRSDRSCASWLIAYHHGLRWEDGRIPYSEAKRLITAAVFEDDAIVYVKGLEKRTWLWNLLLDDERERVYIETLDAVYEDMESLINLDVANTMRCGQHVKNCALQNVLKIYNWWLQKNFFK
ncbi:hypothetical protein ALC57_08307 [Trachymyrmex cornetzi]|uniref:Uncharacterized protein n=1 Tax=Trachymyrmex cornetzi TaxID=471704 RepID=A0A151J727_9HYME|nr:hypothetical protein ALC57_08307 [Trachymyrmex cornetzi]